MKKNLDPFTTKITMSTLLWRMLFFMFLGYTEKSENFCKMEGGMIGSWENFTSEELMKKYFC